MIFDAISSPAFTKITCGVKPTPQLPNASNCSLLELGGRPRFFLSEDVAAPLESPPPPPVPPTGEEIGVGAKPKAMLLPPPSGEYFLGRPLFFFCESMPNPDGDGLNPDESSPE
uniref:Uncharacterized protein n=1 Tax=Opuntia streptacantha TaxID=393608 RepID=A0A7C9AB62_OPUST